MTMKLITVHIPEKFLEALDSLVADGKYPNRSEIIRIAIRDFLKDEVWKKERRMIPVLE
ncbi:MAG: ribbon-helix-helix domain-containing protein [Candidatus Njordarchaeia archaeon]